MAAISSIPTSNNSSLSPSSPRIRLVLFDIGGVFIDSPVEIIRELERKYFLPPHSINKILSKSSSFQLLETGKIKYSQFLIQFQSELNEQKIFSPTSEEIFSSIQSLLENCFLRRSMIELVRLLKENQILVGSITNNWQIEEKINNISNENKNQNNELESFMNPFYSLFRTSIGNSYLFESFHLGIRKPNLQIFLSSIKNIEKQENIKFNMNEILFLDDLRENLNGAKKLGIQTILVRNSWEAVEETLKRTGISHSVAVIQAMEQEKLWKYNQSLNSLKYRSKL